MKLPFHRIGICICVMATTVGALAATASAKDGFVATLESGIPANAKPGGRIDVSWTVAQPTSAGSAVFDATDVFVRLRGPSRRDVTEGYASFKPHPDGLYRAQVAVPRGGIASIEIGVAGTRTYTSGKSERADQLFPITNPPALAGVGSGSGGIGTLTWFVPLLGGLVVVALTVLAARHRLERPQLGT